MNSELYVGHEEFNRQAEEPLIDFTFWLANKAALDLQNKKSPEPIKWLLMGHSRGGAIARILAHPGKIERTVLRNGESRIVVIEVNKDPTLSKVKICDANKKELIQYPLDLYLLLFSATPGIGSKDFKEFNVVGSKILIDFLAATDVGLKSPGYKPLNHRRTINHGSNLFVHMPVRHHVVVKAEPKRIIHLEIELLFSYLFFRHIGVPVDPNGLWTLVRDKSSSRSDTRLKAIDLGEDRGIFSADNCENEACVDALLHKIKLLKTDKNYQTKKLIKVNTHGGTDRRFLVMRSSCYESALEERLELMKQTFKATNNSNSMSQLFEEDNSPEGKAYREFSQNCLNKKGLNDPNLKVSGNLKQFLLLKTAAILHDKKWVTELFTKIETLLGSEATNVKNEILKSLEAKPINGEETLKKDLIHQFLPSLLEQLKGKITEKAFNKFNDYLYKEQNPEVLLTNFIAKTIKGYAEGKQPDYAYLSTTLERIGERYRGGERSRVVEAINSPKLDKLFNNFIEKSIEDFKEDKIKDYKEDFLKDLNANLLRFPKEQRAKKRDMAVLAVEHYRDKLFDTFIFETIQALKEVKGDKNEYRRKELQPKLESVLLKFPEEERLALREEADNILFPPVESKAESKSSSPSPSPDQKLAKAVNGFIFSYVQKIAESNKPGEIKQWEEELKNICLSKGQGEQFQKMRARAVNTIFQITGKNLPNSDQASTPRRPLGSCK